MATEIPLTLSPHTGLLVLSWADEGHTALSTEVWQTESVMIGGEPTIAKCQCLGAGVVSGQALTDLQTAVAPPA